MERPVAGENVKHNLAREHAVRDALCDLLVQQETLLGATRKQLARIDRRISGLRILICKQVRLIETQKTSGRPTDRSVTVLATLNDIMATYQLHRLKVATAIVQA